MPLLPARFYEFNYNPVLQTYRQNEGHHHTWPQVLGYHSEHALDRIKERYGVTMTAQDWERLNWAIFRETNDVKFMFVKSDDTTVYEVTYVPFQRGRKRTLYVMFSETAYCITTAIPLSDIRITIADQGKMRDLKHTFSKLLKRRYDLLTSYSNRTLRNYDDRRGAVLAV